MSSDGTGDVAGLIYAVMTSEPADDESKDQFLARLIRQYLGVSEDEARERVRAAKERIEQRQKR